MTPWVTSALRASRRCWALLQFGHGGDAVGDAAAPVMYKSKPALLQFGHGGDAVGDSFHCRTGRIMATFLQFGHGGDAVGDM